MAGQDLISLFLSQFVNFLLGIGMTLFQLILTGIIDAIAAAILGGLPA